MPVQLHQLFSFRMLQPLQDRNSVVTITECLLRPPLAAAGIEEAIAAEIPLVVWYVKYFLFKGSALLLTWSKYYGGYPTTW